MSKTRLKQGIEEKRGDRSNVPNTIVKQGIGGSLEYCANGTMTIWKTDFEVGMTTYAQKWNTDEIYKRKSAGGFYAENKHHDCGAPPPQGKCWSGLNPSILLPKNKLTVATTNMLRKDNRKKCHTYQEDQGLQSYWPTHEGKYNLPAELPPTGNHRNNMCP